MIPVTVKVFILSLTLAGHPSWPITPWIITERSWCDLPGRLLSNAIKELVRGDTKVGYECAEVYLVDVLDVDPD